MKASFFFTASMFASFAALSHHSNFEYDWDNILEMEGIVTDVRWRNPHIELSVEVTGADGQSEIWEMHAQDVLSLARRGIIEGQIEVGMPIDFAGPASTRRPRNMFVTNVLLPNGDELLLRRNVEPLLAGRVVGAERMAQESGMADAPRGFFHVWGQSNGRPAIQNPPITEAARDAVAAYDRTVDDPALRCIPLGMPGTMSVAGAHPFEIAQSGDDILIRLEGHEDLFRRHL